MREQLLSVFLGHVCDKARVMMTMFLSNLPTIQRSALMRLFFPVEYDSFEKSDIPQVTQLPLTSVIT